LFTDFLSIAFQHLALLQSDFARNFIMHILKIMFWPPYDDRKLRHYNGIFLL